MSFLPEAAGIGLDVAAGLAADAGPNFKPLGRGLGAFGG